MKKIILLGNFKGVGSCFVVTADSKGVSVKEKGDTYCTRYSWAELAQEYLKNRWSFLGQLCLVAQGELGGITLHCGASWTAVQIEEERR